MKGGARLPFWLPALLVSVCLVALGSLLHSGPHKPSQHATSRVLLVADAKSGADQEGTPLAQQEDPVASPGSAATVAASPTAVAQAVPAPATTPTVPPVTSTPSQPSAANPGSRGGARPTLRVGIQAGHWLESQLPDELASLRTATGAAGSGWREQDVNLDIAHRVADLLTADGFQVDLLPSTVPVGYQADAFLALHADANGSTSASGFKAARSSRSDIPGRDDALVAAVDDAYGRLTGLRLDNSTITNNMRYYYTFGGGDIQHAIARSTPGAILEMGFLTNPGDRALLLGSPDLVAKAIVAGLQQYFDNP
ncbi:MAG: N-acetylmuramoyl-L-alanine amidase [Chloroflexi bacterium]|nr:N-acetylmuramoyl-L-alanine amidase [Chloroflexota bacterium]MCL5109002.1 N-acetylmuramoyl-L-alanine amidase [Chloroflexota bacterium]